MPYSDPDNKEWFLNKAKEIKPKRVLDVGAGAGAYGSMLRSNFPGIVLDAIEVWEPYIHEFNLKNIYDNVINIDVREHVDFNYDMVIFGDILEHMTEYEALELWERAISQAGICVISIPIIHYEQGAECDNPYEVHIEEDWTTERVLNKFRGIFEYVEFPVTGVFLAAGDFNIPKKIWQTYKTSYDDLPMYAWDAAGSWRHKNTDWEYNYMNDDEALAFVKENFDSEWVDIYNNCPLSVMRADLWRLMVVYINGGLYADLDTICHVPINYWMSQLRDKKLIINAEHEVHILQWTFAASPKHPALKRVLDLIKEGFKNPDYTDPHFVHVLTGPKAFTVGILDFIDMWNQESKIEIENGVFSGDEHAIKNKHSLNLITDTEKINNSVLAKENNIYMVPSFRFFHNEVSTHLYGSQVWSDGGYIQWIVERGRFSEQTKQDENGIIG